MGEPRRLRLTTSVVLKQKRLDGLLAGRSGSPPSLREAVDDAQLLGSLELAGFSCTWAEVKASRRGEPCPAPIGWLRDAQRAVPAEACFSPEALLAWHGAATGGPGRFRTGERSRSGGPPAAPPAFIESRIQALSDWLNMESGRDLTPFQLGALALARVVEILPFDAANGRVARLAASHLMARAGARPPILVAGDRPRLQECLQAAFQLATEPLCALLEEAAERSLDVMIRVLEDERAAGIS